MVVKATKAKETALLYSPTMVIAVLEDRKTQTRRVNGLEKVNLEPDSYSNPRFDEQLGLWRADGGKYGLTLKCPFGKPGDRLWGRENLLWESYASKGFSGICYEADRKEVDVEIPEDWDPPRTRGFVQTHYDEEAGLHWSEGKVPSIFMPKWACRLHLEITGIRLERLQEISEYDAKAEGVIPQKGRAYKSNFGSTPYFAPYRIAFEILWDSLNERRGLGWDKNPWVWCIEFTRIKEVKQ